MVTINLQWERGSATIEARGEEVVLVVREDDRTQEIHMAPAAADLLGHILQERAAALYAVVPGVGRRP